MTRRKIKQLNIANKELNQIKMTKKIKCAAELIIANKELAYQNDERENRAAALIIFNKELAYQMTKRKMCS
jgi:GTP cyclohydrolase II